MNPVFYLILILHATPFTQAKPFPDEASCQSAGDQLAKDVNVIDPQAGAKAFCLRVPVDTDFLNRANPPLQVAPDWPDAPPPTQSTPPQEQPPAGNVEP